MPTINIGRVRPVFKGEYTETAVYGPLERVMYNGSLYESVQNVPVNAFPDKEDSIYWVKISAPGVQGPQGPQGVQGTQGPPGKDGIRPPISDAVISPHSGVAASSKAVKTAYDAAKAAQATADIPSERGLTHTVFIEDANAMTQLGRYHCRPDTTNLPGGISYGILNTYWVGGNIGQEYTDNSDHMRRWTRYWELKTKTWHPWIPSGIHRGIIVMWAGAVNAVPAGWALCNGQNDTPDLRDRFIVGAGHSYSAHAIGGTWSHNHGAEVHPTTLTWGHLPAHQHHQGSESLYNFYGGGTFIGHRGMGKGSAAAYQYQLTTSSGYSYAHGHGIGIHAHDTRPPYYALAYIMKL